jgi:LPXTG-motif cell wall-anchored protein
MKSLLAGLVIAFCATLLGLAAASPAQAYPDTKHTPATSPPKVQNVPSQGAAAGSSSSTLPNTGGPDALLLGGGVALIAVGGAATIVARRRRNA